MTAARHSRVTLSLTRLQADALLSMAVAAEAGDLYELLDRDGRRVNSALAALNKLRAAVGHT